MLQIFKNIKWQIAQYLEIRWWKQYLNPKNKAEYLEWKQAYWLKVLKLAENISPEGFKLKIRNADQPDNVIWDAGCGPAGIFTVFKKSKIYASDPLLRKYRHNQLLFCAKQENIQFISASLENTKLLESCDLVFCMNALNHVLDIDLATERLGQYFKKDGVLICTLDCHKYNFLKKLFRLIPGDLLHPHQYRLNDYIALLKKHKIKAIGNRKIKTGRIFDHQLLFCERA